MLIIHVWKDRRYYRLVEHSMWNILSLSCSYKTLIFVVFSKTIYSIPFVLMALNLNNLAKSVMNEINMMI
jgi:hypothetical protein